MTRPNGRVSRLAVAVNLAVVSLASSPPAFAQAGAGQDAATLEPVRVTADGRPPETEAKETYQAVTSTIGKGKQALRDIPQSVTVVTERLIDDRNLDTLKDTLHQTSGVTFLAAEGGEEDIRLRGFSLQSTGDIFSDGMRDPAIYERDTFNYDRLEVLRGSASMLFGRGSTGGAVNQVSKQPFMLDQREVDFTLGTGAYRRLETDLNFVTGQDAAFRLAAMKTAADNNGAGSSIDKDGAAGSYRWGIGEQNEFQASLYYLRNRNGINYGLPWYGSAPGELMRVDPSAYYGLDSDYANSDVVHGTFSHTRRFVGGAELKTSLRAGKYSRDQRASTIRFANAAAQPGGQAVTPDNFGDATVLNRGTNNKTQKLDNQIVQSDYTGKFRWFGRVNAITTGVDFNHEFFEAYSAVGGPAKPPTTAGSDEGGPAVDESLRSLRRNREFDALSGGVYFQDLIQITDHWKLLGGLRWDYLNGDYKSYATADATQGNITAERGRSDSLWSKRFGVLYQPTSQASFHASYGTSFNTSGDTYQFDAAGSNTAPEKSRNIELGGKFDLAGGDLSLRTAIFHSTKYNERNRDEETVNATNYVLSGQRYAKGFEADVAGRITPDWEAYVSYTWIPVAKVKKGSLAGAGETVGQRPGLIPKHQATLWNTYKHGSDWRFGLGLNGRTKMAPQQVNTYKVDGYLTVDAMIEYQLTRELAFKLNATNLTNKLYADSLYRGHWIPGPGRSFQLTAAYKF
ncbi:MAG: TonB-dependent siderophore receptor [Candidatus Dactylopiibacterium sp.]|nr:TonB-dependent siderophore receptor [Candidatus Dactylopiibacterium sp.]